MRRRRRGQLAPLTRAERARRRERSTRRLLAALGPQKWPEPDGPFWTAMRMAGFAP